MHRSLLRRWALAFFSLSALLALRSEPVQQSPYKEAQQVQGSFFSTFFSDGIFSFLRNQVQKWDKRVEDHFHSDDLVITSDQQRLDDLCAEIQLLNKEKSKLKQQRKFDSKS
ncbi:hypothetical protein [Candidatus Similichlamydia laticola]|uniref:Uncharacterized protein n=1 Tax=Candidatus Similichlamydia laticola TaxID=2170265 RepID=A0A369KEW9_9BACT|nr:hypothetical protein [Candidatus Similichlamydia laticola]RDB31437.1 hypothetical protein HAT2_00458 [Candidatus Similichlamydia laticola]